MNNVTILTGDPTIELIAEMELNPDGVVGMAEWVKSHRPECLPSAYDEYVGASNKVATLFPHTDNISDNERLVELAGRKCYDSFGLKAGRKSNKEYIANTQLGDIPHASILYHAKMTFFIAGVSRRVSQEIFRNYVGSDRDTEGSPSQESSRYTHHYGYFVAHPTLADNPEELEAYRQSVQRSYDDYTAYIERRFTAFEQATGKPCVGMDRKRVYESSIGRMPWDFETSFMWTTNPGALSKFFKERCDNASDVEMQRFAKKWRGICLKRWANLFPRVQT